MGSCVRSFVVWSGVSVYPTIMAGKYKIVMVRHGESEWNQLNKFCGWYDADLSAKGRDEAAAAGVALAKEGWKFDVAHTSVLTRANKTLAAIMSGISQTDLTVQKTWRLNERHYGGLTGLNKAETAEKHGEEQVKIWRRSFDIPPPPMDEQHNYSKIISGSRRYKDLKAGELPTCESLKDTIARALPYWNDVIAPQIKAGKNVIIAAHGNSLRGIVKHLEGMSDAAIMELNLPTGIPIVYELDADLKPIKPMAFLGDEETVKKAMEAVAAQGKAKKEAPPTQPKNHDDAKPDHDHPKPDHPKPDHPKPDHDHPKLDHPKPDHSSEKPL